MNLGDVHLNRDGTIRHDGDAIGYVYRTEGPSLGKWRAEIGDPAKLDLWPPYRATYADTRRGAVAAVLEDLEAPS